MNLAFRVLYRAGKRIKHSTEWQCYFCLNYYARQDKFDCHVENCRRHYVYKFSTESVFTFDENLKYKSDISIVAYIDFETTAKTGQQ